MHVSLKHYGPLVMTLFVASQAIAQDWRGFYAGGNIGYGRASGTTQVVGRASGIELDEGFVDGRNTSIKLHPSGVCFGGQIGYNWQSGNALFGVEGDLTRPDMESKKTEPIRFLTGAVIPNGYARTSQEIKMLSTIRARVGYVPTPNLLAYVTAGVAAADVKYSSDMDYRNVPGYGFHLPATYSKIRFGYALGAGAELAVAKNMSTRVEYLYYHLQKESKIGHSTPVPLVNDFKYTWKLEAQELRFGLNLRF